MSEEKEVIAYAITHAPPGVKGGPYEAESGPPGEECDSLRDACRWPTTEPDARECAAMYLEDHLSWCGDARVIRIVRARPSEAEPTQQPHEASAVEVLRELVAWSDNEDADTDDVIRIAGKARRVLAASGPNPMPVVRAAMAYEAASSESATQEWRALESAVKAYRKAGGK